MVAAPLRVLHLPINVRLRRALLEEKHFHDPLPPADLEWREPVIKFTTSVLDGNRKPCRSSFLLTTRVARRSVC